MSVVTSETLRSVLHTLRGQPILMRQSIGQRGALLLDLLSLGSRAALGGTFLLSILDRLGLYGNPGERGVSWGTFERFLGYTASVNAFAPASQIGRTLSTTENYLPDALARVCLPCLKSTG